MREFFNNIDHLPEGIQKLRGERHVFVYGVGEYAAKVLQTLERFHIEIEGIVTSAEYYSGNNSTCAVAIWLGAAIKQQKYNSHILPSAL